MKKSKTRTERSILDMRSSSLDDLYKKLIERIVQDRIYKNEELIALFSETVHKNKDIFGEEKVTEVCLRVKAELDAP